MISPMAPRLRAHRGPSLQEALQAPPAQAADQFRASARTLLRQQMSFPLTSEVELTALTLCERSLIESPQSATPAAPQLGQHALYYSNLAALAGAPGGALTAGAVAILEQFRCWDQPHPKSPLRTLGEFADQLAATRALGGSQAVECSGFPVEICGHLNDQELNNVHQALEEIVQKTETKALHLVKGVFLRPFLAEALDTQGRPSQADGLSCRKRWVGMIHASARNADSCRQALFHELGHELDHVLSGGRTLYRSDQPDAPFGKSPHRQDYVSEYATTSPAEDFAETHAALILQWDEFWKDPQGYIGTHGMVGEKMAWIAEHGYRLPVPRFPGAPGEATSSS